jgi:hypothetical protein
VGRRRIDNARALVALIIAGAGYLGSGTAFAQNSTFAPPLPTEVRAKIHALESQVFDLTRQVAQLRAALADAEAKLAGAGLTAEAQRLQKEREALNAELCGAAKLKVEDCTVDWSKIPPAVTKKEPAHK